jgi:hypothetical protein
LSKARRRCASVSTSKTQGGWPRSTRFFTIQAPINPLAPVMRKRAWPASACGARTMLAHYMFWTESVNAASSAQLQRALGPCGAEQGKWQAKVKVSNPAFDIRLPLDRVDKCGRTDIILLIHDVGKTTVRDHRDLLRSFGLRLHELAASRSGFAWRTDPDSEEG